MSSPARSRKPARRLAPFPVTAILLLVAGAARAQAPPACADSVARRLGPLVGMWGVRAIFAVERGWDTTNAVATIAPAFQGCLLQEVLNGTRDGEPFSTFSLWGAVGLHGTIQRTFVHSQHGLLGVYSGDPGSEGLVLRDSQVVRGTLVLFEHRFEPFVGDSMRFTSRRSTDHGATWRVSWYADYRRRGHEP